MSNNIGESPIIINGRGIKSINQFYNKRLAKIKGQLINVNGVYWSNWLSTLTTKRFYRIKNFMHHASKYVVSYCKENNIDTIVCGLSKKWKQYQNIGKQNTQTMQSIPFNMFIRQLEYKCQEASINFIVTEESYTSGTSFMDNELPIEENYNIKRRKKRGLFYSDKGIINADVNASLQIMKKVFPNAFADGIEVNLTPSIINAVNT